MKGGGKVRRRRRSGKLSSEWLLGPSLELSTEVTGFGKMKAAGREGGVVGV